MANNKMLIDASHQEETRVVVVRGNRIEEFDFEAQERAQLRGNIYLAKVTRVEPSLQAAFIDYGGNRHGFLAFSEIHPDYYQIPAADRQALLDAEEEAAASEDENGSDELGSSATDVEEEPDEKPKKRSRKNTRRGGRTRKAKNSDDNDGEIESTEDTVEEIEGADEGIQVEASTSDESSLSSDDSSEETSESKDEDLQNEEEPVKKHVSRTVSAIIENDGDGDSISEPASENGDEDEGEEKPKKKRRTTRKKAAPKKKATKKDAAENNAEAVEATADDTVSSDEAGDSDEKPKKTRKTARRKTTRKKKPAESEELEAEDIIEAKEDGNDESGDDSEGDNNNGNSKPVESVGQEDALEEVPARKRPRRHYKIQEVIRRRQIMLVQVVKEERGNKGAALTTYLSLAGRYSVLMPNTARGGGISRKITNPGDRKRLKEIAGQLDVPKGMGVILRTAGAARTPEEITRDFEYLMRLWENVRNLTLESSAPFLVYEEGSLIKRSIRDLYSKDTGEIIVSGEQGFKEAKDFMKMLLPSHEKNVKLYKGEQSLLSKFNIESQLDKMLASQVTLKSGGYLVINQTEALVAIDVNSGRSTRQHSIEATALQTNLEAAEEAARQLRLRDLAGLVVIDFIDMEEKRNNRAVERKMKECLKRDRARIQVGHISHFGLLEMSRQRMRASVLESTMQTCPHCEGTGHIRSQSSLALHIFRAIDDHLNRNARFDVKVSIPPALALYILNHKRQAVNELENRWGVHIEFISDNSIEGQNFSIEKGDRATFERKQVSAVNPMQHNTDDEIDNKEASDSSENPSVMENDEEETTGPRKRRRRRSRGRKGDQNDNERSGSNIDAQSENTSSETESTALVEDTDSTKVMEESAPAKPKRGRRAKAPVTESADEKRAAAKIEAEGDSQPKKEDEPVNTKPKRTTGRPGKKAKLEADTKLDQEETEPVSSEENVSDNNASGNGAPAQKPKRRTTRRVSKKVKEENVTSDGDEQQPPVDGFLS